MAVPRTLKVLLPTLAIAAAGCGAEFHVEGSVPVLQATELRAFSDSTRDWGRSILAADLDGDGLPEIILGCPSLDDEQGGLVVVVSGADLSIATVLVPDNSRRQQGERRRFGESLAAADFDGDGRVDLAVGAPSMAGPGEPAAGEVWTYPGPVGEIEPRVCASPQPRAEGAFGAVLEAADLDGDGHPDLLVSEPGSGGAAQSRVWELDGVDLRPRRQFAARDLDTEFGSELEVLRSSSGLPSLIIGAPAAVDGSGQRRGAAYLVEGDAGLEEALLRLTPSGAGRRFAASVAQGDFDGDGEVEIVVSAFEGEAALYVFEGARWDSPTRRGLDPDLVPGPGSTLYSLPDVTGDGRDELLILGERETWLMSGNRLERPLARLPFRADGVAASDVDGDGRGELWVTTTGSTRGDGISVLRLVDFDVVEVRD